jgi:hypothetical protein
MFSQNTVKLSNGDVLTAKLWRKGHPLFNYQPFYSNIPRMDDMGDDLRRSISVKEWYGSMLVVSNLAISNPRLISLKRILEKD